MYKTFVGGFTAAARTLLAAVFQAKALFLNELVRIFPLCPPTAQNPVPEGILSVF